VDVLFSCIVCFYRHSRGLRRFLFPLKKKNQKENSPLTFSSIKVSALAWLLLSEDSGGGRTKLTEGLVRQFSPFVIARSLGQDCVLARRGNLVAMLFDISITLSLNYKF
jgi:hypothetical protein